MKQMRMKALAILLTLVMLLSLFPAAFAVEDEDYEPAEGSAQASLQDDYDLYDDDLFDEVIVIFWTRDYDMRVGGSLTINDAQIYGVSGSMRYQWVSDNPSVATVSGSGDTATVTAKSAGSARITLTATRSDGNSDSDSLTINVEGGNTQPVTAKGSPSGSLTLDAGKSQTVSVSASGGSGSYEYVWEEGSGAVSVDGNGQNATVTGLYAGSGTVTVTAFDRDDYTKYDTIHWNVNVKSSSTPLTAHISQNEMVLATGERGTLSLIASGGSGNSSNYEYTWSSDNPSVASVSGSGSSVTVTAASSLAGSSGSAQIRAYVYDRATGTTSESSYCGVVVQGGSASYNASSNASVGSTLSMNSIASNINSAFSTKFINESLSYSASVRLTSPSGNAGFLCLQDGTRVRANQSYTYASFQDMYFEPTAAGNFSTAYSITDGGKIISGTISISVTGGGDITSASLNPSSMRLATYSSQYVYLSVTPANASYTVTWSSSDTRVATVSGSGGSATVYSQGRTGSADITASIRCGGGTLTRSIHVTVYSDASSYNPSLSITAGSDYYGTGISDSITKQWRNVYGVNIGDNASLVFSSLGNSRYGTLYLRNGSPVRANTTYTYRDFIDTYFEPYSAGSYNLPYTLTYGGNVMSGTMQIEVRASSLTVSMNPTSISIAPYSNRTVSLTIRPSNAYYRVSWSTSNGSVATVSGNGDTATIYTQGKTGTASITATVIDANNNRINRSCSVQVNTSAASNYDPSISIPIGSVYTGTGTADAIMSQFKNVYNVTVDKNRANIVFSSMGDSRIGVLHMPNGNAAKANTTYTLAQYRDEMYVEPVSAGTLRLPYTMTYNGKTLSGTACFVIGASNINCSLSLPDTQPYQFNKSLTGGTGSSQLSKTITNAVGSSWTYIRFTSTSSNSNVGVLYQNPSKTALNANTNISAQMMEQLYFVPAQPGTYSAPFSVYNNSGKLADGSLSIVVPGSAPAKSTFTDVPADAYYAQAVEWAVQKGITTGTTATTFSPSDTVTRGQAVTFLWRANGQPAASSANPFNDVAADMYYTPAILWAVEKGITNGTSANTFSPNATLAQDQMITFLCRASGVSAFGDNWSESAMSWAQGKGLFNGRPGVPGAKDPCPRCDVVYYLWKSAN